MAYTQTIDAEGRAVTIRNSDTGETWTSTYDGDGARIRQVNPDGTSTLFLAGGLYEVTLSAGGQQTGVKRYYAIGGAPIAVRDSSDTYYLLTDHLGSVVSILDGSGVQVYQQRYREASRSGAEGPPLRPAAPEHLGLADRSGIHGST